MSLIKWIDFQKHGDERGQLVALEIGKERNIPFDIKRIYYIYHTEKGVSRGFHAGSTPILRTLQKSLIIGQRSVYAKEKEIQPGIQKGCR